MAESWIDELYAAPLGGFVELRKQLARAHRAAGRRDEAAAIAAARKPSAALWLANQLARVDKRRVRRLVDASQEQRALQAAAAATDLVALRRVAKRRDGVLRELVKRAEKLADEHGLRLSRATRQRLESLLAHAPLVDGAREALLRGRLASEELLAGFDVLASAPSSTHVRQGEEPHGATARGTHRELAAGAEDQTSVDAQAKPAGRAGRSKRRRPRRISPRGNATARATSDAAAVRREAEAQLADAQERFAGAQERHAARAAELDRVRAELSAAEHGAKAARRELADARERLDLALKRAKLHRA
jgi:hypothetical protein